MFIPRGEIIHESLATSYVLVDALVSDLCEGGFSGVVDVVLRDTDSFIVIASGTVAAVFDKRDDHARSGANINYSRTTVEQLADRSRRERGRVSIYGYSAATASCVAGRINAKALYVGLSTEFTDLEKMIGKLVRERDREWFIEINTESGPGALIHIRDSECRILRATGHSDSGTLGMVSSPLLGHLIDECNRAAGTFDVYFTQVAAETFVVPEQIAPEHIPLSLPVEEAILHEEPVAPPQMSLQHSASGLLTANEMHIDSSREPERLASPDPGERSLERAEPEGLVVPDIDEARLERAEPEGWMVTDPGELNPEPAEQLGVSNNAVAAVAGAQSSFAPPAETATAGLAKALIEPQAGDLSLVRDELPPVAADAEAMAEIKRLMGEMASAIEGAAQAVGRPDSFSMSLRAGQLTIADRYPFLDPFAGDFEYLAGEIVFVGHAAAEEFVAGLTEALKLAIQGVTRSTAYADRFRTYVTEDLQKLLVRERAEFERLGLDQVIQQIVTEGYKSPSR